MTWQYAQLDDNQGKQQKYPLHDATTVPQAITKRQVLKDLQREGKLLPPNQMALSGDTPTAIAAKNNEKIDEEDRPAFSLAEAVEGYRLDRDALGKKDDDTRAREDSGLRLWVEKFGDVLFEEITDGTLVDFATWRKKRAEEQDAHVSGRTIDLNVMAMQQVRNWAKLKGHLPKSSANWYWEKLAEAPSKDDLLTPKQVEEICNAALLNQDALELIDKRNRHLRAAQAVSGQAFHDYLRLLQHAGGREHETTLQRWTYVTWGRIAEHDGDGGLAFKKGDKIPGNLFFPGEDAKAGGGKPAEDRSVIFHQDLEDHLRAMYERRDPSTDWMFPSRHFDGPTKRFNKQLHRVKKELRARYCEGHPGTKKNESFWFDRVTFQWFRHYFISHAVMAGIDYKTIAYWVSHRDGGVLIGRLYGHLDTTHEHAMSAKLTSHLLSRR
jgi:integrase